MNMTARENVFLNGTVLGHSRKFMEEHFDEIIEFAELKDFLDVPIKNFSSGMQASIGCLVVEQRYCMFLTMLILSDSCVIMQSGLIKAM